MAGLEVIVGLDPAQRPSNHASHPVAWIPTARDPAVRPQRPSTRPMGSPYPFNITTTSSGGCNSSSISTLLLELSQDEEGTVVESPHPAQ